MIVLLGASGYVGQKFVRELSRRGLPFLAVSRAMVDYTRFTTLHRFLRDIKPELVINAAGSTGKPNVDACEDHKTETLLGNTLLPQTVAHACSTLGIPWGHVSSGCIYNGVKITQSDGSCRIAENLVDPQTRGILETHPERVRGFAETDPPNFSFDHPPCSFYSGSKAAGEAGLEGMENGFIWRLRMPFDELDSPRNYLSKLQRYPRIYQNTNSLSHTGDYVSACLDCWEKRAPWGTYNVTNTHWISTKEIVELLCKHLTPGREYVFFPDDREFYSSAAKVPRSNCILDNAKLRNAGVKIPEVRESLVTALRNWTPV